MDCLLCKLCGWGLKKAMDLFHNGGLLLLNNYWVMFL